MKQPINDKYYKNYKTKPSVDYLTVMTKSLSEILRKESAENDKNGSAPGNGASNPR